MSCIFKYKGQEYDLDAFNAVAPKLQKKAAKVLHKKGFKRYKNAFKLETNKGDNAYKQAIVDIAEAQNAFPEAINGSVFKIEKRPGATVIDIDLNPVLPVHIEKWKRDRNNGTQLSLFQIKEELAEKTKPINRLDKLLSNFLSTNGIGLEAYNTLKEKLGVDARGAYDLINKIVYIAKNDLKEDTLPEEVGHVITETLGKNHPLIKLLKAELKKTGYKQFLSPEYLSQYEGNEEALLAEAAGKIIGKSLVSKFKESQPSTLKDILNKIIKFFKRKFNLNTTDLEKEYSKIYATSDEIAKQVLSNNFDTSFQEFSQTQPDNAIFFQLKEEKKDIFNEEEKNRKKLLVHHQARVTYLQGKLFKETDEAKKESLTKRIEEYKELIEQHKLEGFSKGSALDMAKHTMKTIKSALMSLDEGKLTVDDLTDNDIEFMYTSLKLFSTHASLASTATDLQEMLEPYIRDYYANLVNKNRLDRQDRSYEELLEIEEDVNSYRSNLGALSDINSVLGTTVATEIKRAQNDETRANKKIGDSIVEATKKLKEVQAARGISEANMYDIFIQKGKDTTFFVSRYNQQYYTDRKEALKKRYSGDSTLEAEGKAWLKRYSPLNKELKDSELPEKYKNKNYEIIQSNKGLKEFYDFYVNTMEEAFSKLPVKNRVDFIPNIKDKTLQTLLANKGFKGGFKELLRGYLELEGSSINKNTDDLLTDALPLMFIKPLNPDEKSDNLGNSLNVFARFAENYSQMMEVLPRLRMLQDLIEKKDYDPSFGRNRISGKDSNLAKMVEETIEMQVKGKMKKDSGKVEINGKQFHLSTIGDRFLGYNSLLRIGFNPMNAFSNVLIGDVSNFVEGFGGKFFNLKELHKATSIFTTDAFKKDSKMNKLVQKLNILQELDDYDALTGTAKKMSPEKVKEVMFSLQKKGEYYLQARPMVASMLHDKVKDLNGKEHSLYDAFDDNGEWKTEQFGELTNEALDRITNRIQRINQIIHGRYSSRDAGAATQHILVRAALQFRKWIPTALENRVAAYSYDNRLGEDFEGRWRTGIRLLNEAFLSSDPDKRAFTDMVTSVFKNAKDLAEKDLTPLERANIRKNLIEVVLIAASITASMMLIGGDDDKDKITNPAAKILADQLNRISGDLLYFMNPKEYIGLGRNIIPAAKTAMDLTNTLLELPNIFGGEDSEYRSGPRKGENKFWSKAGSSIIFVKPITDLGRYFWNDQPYIEIKKQ